MSHRPPDPGARLARCAPRLAVLLYALAGRHVRAHVEIDDLLQEVFVRTLADPAGLPLDDAAGELELGRRLARNARRTVIDVARALRAQKRAGPTVPLDRSRWSRDGGTGSVAAPWPGPATEAGAREGVARLAATWRALAPEHRRVIRLRQLESLSAAETARAMQRSEAAVHSLYRRALEAWEALLA